MENNAEIKTPNNKLRSLGLKRSIQKCRISKTPLSDVKISYTPLDTPASAEVHTPILTASAGTTNRLPYRLSLSKSAREKYKKKKLEFAANIDAESPLDVYQDILIKEKILQQHRKHQGKVEELKTVVATWTEAFRNSLEELSTKIEPKMEKEDLLARLGLSPDMIDLT